MTETEMKALKVGDRVHTEVASGSSPRRTKAELKPGAVVSPWPELKIQLDGEFEVRSISEGQHWNLHLSR